MNNFKPEPITDIRRTILGLGTPHFTKRLGGSQGNRCDIMARPARPCDATYPKDRSVLFDLVALTNGRASEVILSGVLRALAPGSGAEHSSDDLAMDLRTHVELFDAESRPIVWPELTFKDPGDQEGRLFSTVSLQLGSAWDRSNSPKIQLLPLAEVCKSRYSTYGAFTQHRTIQRLFEPVFCNLSVSTGVEGAGRGFSVVDASPEHFRTLVRAWFVSRYRA